MGVSELPGGMWKPGPLQSVRNLRTCGAHPLLHGASSPANPLAGCWRESAASLSCSFWLVSGRGECSLRPVPPSVGGTGRVPEPQPLPCGGGSCLCLLHCGGGPLLIKAIAFQG